jgi:hypothetical protein
MADAHLVIALKDDAQLRLLLAVAGLHQTQSRQQLCLQRPVLLRLGPSCRCCGLGCRDGRTPLGQLRRHLDQLTPCSLAPTQTDRSPRP